MWLDVIRADLLVHRPFPDSWINVTRPRYQMRHNSCYMPWEDDDLAIMVRYVWLEISAIAVGATLEPPVLSAQ